MKIGVISDTHIPIACKQLPDKIKEHIKDADMILHAGDLIELNVLDELKKITPNVIAVYGNMDSTETQSELPRKKIIKANNYTIGLIHGWGGPQFIIERIRKEFKNVDIIVFGHLHKAVNLRKDGVLFFNPGSATDKIFTDVNSIGILELNDEIKSQIIEILN